MNAQFDLQDLSPMKGVFSFSSIGPFLFEERMASVRTKQPPPDGFPPLFPRFSRGGLIRGGGRRLFRTPRSSYCVATCGRATCSKESVSFSSPHKARGDRDPRIPLYVLASDVFSQRLVKPWDFFSPET